MVDLGQLQTMWGLSPHQASFLHAFLQIYNVKGKDILELGGAMPKALVIDHLGANSWTCLQSLEYAKFRDDNQTPSTATDSATYQSIYAEAESYLTEKRYKYDAVFSIAAFEHFLKLPTVIRLLPDNLVAEGVLFSIFAPIWSGPYGQHFTHDVPNRFALDERGTPWSTQTILDGPWDHLVLTPSQYLQRYTKKFDREFAELLTYETYHSPQINRLFFEDYSALFSGHLKQLVIKPIFPITLNSESTFASQFKLVQVLHKEKGYVEFLHAGIFLVMQK